MDPTANLKEQIEIAEAITEHNEDPALRAERLAELVIALNEWLVRGGFLPHSWRYARGAMNDIESKGAC